MNNNSQPFANYPITKSQLLDRFRKAREKLGVRWRVRMSERYPFYDTRKGILIMMSATNALNNEKLIAKDKLEALVIAMETLVDTEKKLKS